MRISAQETARVAQRLKCKQVRKYGLSCTLVLLVYIGLRGKDGEDFVVAQGDMYSSWFKTLESFETEHFFKP